MFIFYFIYLLLGITGSIYTALSKRSTLELQKERSRLHDQKKSLEEQRHDLKDQILNKKVDDSEQERVKNSLSKEKRIKNLISSIDRKLSSDS